MGAEEAPPGLRLLPGQSPWDGEEGLTGSLPLAAAPSPFSPDPWRQSPRQPQSSGRLGWEGIDSYCPFVFLLLLFVSSFFPAPHPWGPHCTALSPSPVSPAPPFPLLPSLALFLGLCLPTWSLLCFCLSDFPFSYALCGCSCPSLGWVTVLKPYSARTHRTHRSSCPWPISPQSGSPPPGLQPPLAHLPGQERLGVCFCHSLRPGTFPGVAGWAVGTGGGPWDHSPSEPFSVQEDGRFRECTPPPTPHPRSHHCLCT